MQGNVQIWLRLMLRVQASRPLKCCRHAAAQFCLTRGNGPACREQFGSASAFDEFSTHVANVNWLGYCTQWHLAHCVLHASTSCPANVWLPLVVCWCQLRVLGLLFGGGPGLCCFNLQILLWDCGPSRKEDPAAWHLVDVAKHGLS